jgi:hypothetical protein
VEIEVYGIDADLDTNEIPEIKASTEETMTSTFHHSTGADTTMVDEYGEESKINTVVVHPESTSDHPYHPNEETTEADSEDATLPDLNEITIMKDSITVNVSSFDLYLSGDDTESDDDDATENQDETITQAEDNLQVQLEDIASNESLVEMTGTTASTEQDLTSTTVVQDTTEPITTSQSDDTTLLSTEDETTLNEESTQGIDTTVATILDTGEQETTVENDAEDTTILHTPTQPTSSELHTAASTFLTNIETSTFTSPTPSPQEQPTTAGIPQVTVDKYGRPKNRPSVHRFPSSGAVSRQALCTTSNIIKSIGLMFIQLKMISN